MTARTVSVQYFGKNRFQSEEEARSRRWSHGGRGSRFTEQAIGALHRRIPEGRVLDLACGNGRNLPKLLSRFPRVFGCDISAPMLQVAKQAPLIRAETPLTQLEAERLPFADEAFDGVFCARFLHHVPTPEIRGLILSEIFRVARRAAVVTYKPLFSIEHIRCAIRGRFPWRDRRAHRFFVARTELEQTANQNGWRLVETVSAHGPFSSNRAAVFERL